MEALLSFCFISLSYILALWFLNFSSHKSKACKHRLPPGPWTLPIIGSLHHVASVVPHRKITELCRRHGPVMFLKLGQVPTVVVSSAEAAAQVMRANDIIFASRPSSPTQMIMSSGGKGMAFAPYGDHWRQMRKVCMVELLSSRQVRRMEGIRLDEVGSLLRYIVAAASTGATINLGEKTMSLTNNVVSRAVFGGKFLQQEEYLHELDLVLTLLGGACLVDLFPLSKLARLLSSGARRMKSGCARIQGIIGDVIEERKATRAACDGGCSLDEEDLLDVLLRLQKEDSLESPLTRGALTRENICVVLSDIFAGGTDTTGSVLQWAMSELVRHPDVMAKAQEEIRHVLGQDRDVITHGDLSELHFLRMVIKEVLRLHLPAPLIPRIAREDCKILGYDILKGTALLVNIYAISRDPKDWQNPEEFVPERFENNIDYSGTNFQFTPFGSGRRQCPGLMFAQSTLEITLANLIYHFDWVLPAGASPESLDMSEKFGFTLGRRCDLELIAIARGRFHP